MIYRNYPMLHRGVHEWTLSVLYFSLLWISISCETTETCLGDVFRITCPEQEVIITQSADLGRMESGMCIHGNQFIGCQNDALYLVDKWCSGRQECERIFRIRDVSEANTECEDFLQMYLRVNHLCVKVSSAHCQSQNGATLTDTEGMISSHVTDETGCGTTRSPWVIAAMPGQTIELSIIDFGSETYKREGNTTSIIPIYGTITDGPDKVTFGGSVTRKRELLRSKTHHVSIDILPTSQRNDNGFLIQYKKHGCPDLTPPAHAWYKRDGDQAVIGCEWSQKTWHLSCDGHGWTGVVGNCSQPEADQEGPVETNSEDGSPSALWLVCVVSVSVVLMVVACVIGVVCIKKTRIKQDVQKSMTLQRLPGQGHYDLDPNIEMASMLYLPYKSCEQEQGTLSDPQRPTSYLVPQDQVVNELSPIRIWERPLPDLPDKSLGSGTMCACPTSRRGRTPGDGDEAVDNSNVQEDGTLQSYQTDVSTTPSQGGHKYSALGAQNA